MSDFYRLEFQTEDTRDDFKVYLEILGYDGKNIEFVLFEFKRLMNDIQSNKILSLAVKKKKPLL